MKKIFAIIAISAVLTFSFLIYTAFTGNPIKHIDLRIKTEKYLKYKYPELEVLKIKTLYNFKNAKYFSKVKVHINSDLYFYVSNKYSFLVDDLKQRVLNQFIVEKCKDYFTENKIRIRNISPWIENIDNDYSYKDIAYNGQKIKRIEVGVFLDNDNENVIKELFVDFMNYIYTTDLNITMDTFIIIRSESYYATYETIKNNNSRFINKGIEVGDRKIK